MLRQWTASESISKFWLAEENESLVQSSIQVDGSFVLSLKTNMEVGGK